MKTKRIMLGIGTVGLLLLNLLSSPAYGQANGGMNQAMTIATFGLMSPRLLGALNLTPEQAMRIEGLKEAFRQAQRAYLKEIIPLRTEVADKLFGPNPVSEADVAGQITKIADLREKILREGFRIAYEMRRVLTPEQLAKAAAIRQQLLKIGSEVRDLYNENQ
ncbi:MAG: periplasmic heavy metal sensor [Deltaproteobacteria bacterium]|nr:periplasmic heavy metal sensor [Deltaproteobacteria bacterium]